MTEANMVVLLAKTGKYSVKAGGETSYSKWYRPCLTLAIPIFFLGVLHKARFRRENKTTF